MYNIVSYEINDVFTYITVASNRTREKKDKYK